MKKFVILDRDGVINEDAPDHIKSPEEWVPVPGSLEAIALLSARGFDIYVATNQSGIARGFLSLDDLSAIHEKLIAAVQKAGGAIRDIRFCPHHPDDDCICRKPRPGLLLDLARDHGLDLKQGDFVGDSPRDLEAAKAAPCRGVLVLTGNGRETRRNWPHHEPVHADLLAYARDKVTHPD